EDSVRQAICVAVVLLTMAAPSTLVFAQSSPVTQVSDDVSFVSRRVRVSFGAAGIERPSLPDSDSRVLNHRIIFQQRIGEAWTQRVCGMPAMRADPAVDPRFSQDLPSDGIQYFLRLVPAPVCLERKDQ